MNINQIIGDYQSFFLDLLFRLDKINIDITGMPISHICYRVTTLQEYLANRDQLKEFSHSFMENDYNGRPISMFLLKIPLVLSEKSTVSLIEFPAPKPSHTYPKGLEHCGFIVGASLVKFNGQYQGYLTGTKDRGLYCQPSFITFDNGSTAKFYEKSLQEVVQLEGLQFKLL